MPYIAPWAGHDKTPPAILGPCDGGQGGAGVAVNDARHGISIKELATLY